MTTIDCYQGKNAWKTNTTHCTVYVIQANHPAKYYSLLTMCITFCGRFVLDPRLMEPRTLLNAQCGQASAGSGFDRLAAGNCSFQNSAVCSADSSSFAGVSCRKSQDCHMTMLTMWVMGYCSCDCRYYESTWVCATVCPHSRKWASTRNSGSSLWLKMGPFMSTFWWWVTPIYLWWTGVQSTGRSILWYC